MSDGFTVVFHSWLPEGEVGAIVILSHGMAEHAVRYERFAQALTAAGFALFAEDHRGHGETGTLSVQNGTGALGFLAPAGGFMRVVEDIHEEVLLIKNRYPHKKIILFGHSFGSFVSQAYIELYAKTLDGCILCGTAGPRTVTVKSARVVQRIVCFFTGKRHPSALLQLLAFGSYNAKISPQRTAVDWLSRDTSQVDLYIKDPLCGFLCTTGFFGDLFYGLDYIHKKKNLAAIDKQLPVLFIDGTGDPVGSYAKTVRHLYSIYTDVLNLTNVELKLYPDARHELLNETNYTQVQEDVLTWLSHRL